MKKIFLLFISLFVAYELSASCTHTLLQRVGTQYGLDVIDYKAAELQQLKIEPINYMYFDEINHDMSEINAVEQFLKEHPVYFCTVQQFIKAKVSAEDCRLLILKTMNVLAYPVESEWLQTNSK